MFLPSGYGRCYRMHVIGTKAHRIPARAADRTPPYAGRAAGVGSIGDAFLLLAGAFVTEAWR
jgi:hypothetical protein